ncbi:hypothetical protein FB45DRAFT_879586 [Roridomyces roridus]|uniref:Uncharacterized protein n=1 Tax=Roridomyces roridus TaxID=1738132 RepID=A0AAD7AZA9_9AGAR|nr:hypothetical protein FB45DRAFT_879586 [Roridomyces roridus]
MAVYTCPMPFSRGINFGNHKDHDGSTKRFWFVVLFQGVYTLYSDAASRMDEHLRGRDLFIFLCHVHAEEFWARHCVADHRHDQRGEIGPNRHIRTPPPSPSDAEDEDDLFIDDTPPKKKQRGETAIPSSCSPSVFTPVPRGAVTPVPKAAVKMETPRSSRKHETPKMLSHSDAHRAPAGSASESISTGLPSYSVSSPIPSSSSISAPPPSLFQLVQ